MDVWISFISLHVFLRIVCNLYNFHTFKFPLNATATKIHVTIVRNPALVDRMYRILIHDQCTVFDFRWNCAIRVGGAMRGTWESRVYSGMSSQFPFSDTGDIDGDVGPFITVANRSPVSRREAVLQVFRQHRNTSEVYRPATNGRRRLPRRRCR